jgi:hypothetical protein
MKAERTGIASRAAEWGVVILTALCALVCATALPCRAENVAPDSATLATLAAELPGAQVVRVTGAAGVRTLKDVRLDAHGVASARWKAPGRSALIVSRDEQRPPKPPPIAWNDISRIETGQSHGLRSGVVGAAIGALAGYVIWETIPTGYDGGQGPAGVIIGVPALAGFAFGAFLGSQSYHWTTVYTGSPGGR